MPGTDHGISWSPVVRTAVALIEMSSEAEPPSSQDRQPRARPGGIARLRAFVRRAKLTPASWPPIGRSIRHSYPPLIGAILLLALWAYLASHRNPGVLLQARINASANARLVIPAGTYATTGLKCVSNLVIESDGPVVLVSDTEAPMLDLSHCSNVSLRGDFTLIGKSPPYTGHTTQTGPAAGGQTGIKLDRSERISIEGRVEIRNIAGTCLDAQSSLAWQSVTLIRGLIVNHCYRGIHLHDAAEYMTFSDFNAFNNVYGVVVESGNNSFANGKVVYNSVAIRLAGGTNHAHGIFTAVEANHNAVNLQVQDVTLGQTFLGCHFIGDQAGGGGSRIELIASKGVNIVGGQIGSDISLEGGSQLSLQSNYIRTDITNAPRVAAGSLLIARDNFGPTGPWASNSRILRPAGFDDEPARRLSRP